MLPKRNEKRETGKYVPKLAPMEGVPASMSKFKGGFQKAVEEEIEKEQEQKRLREKHQISDEQVLIVEKDDLAKFLIRTGIAAVKLIITITILSLAVLGLLALTYPVPREALFQVLAEILSEFRHLI